MRDAAIIADYGKETGSGHLIRCGSLAKELTSDFSVRFICADKEFLPFISDFAEKIGCSAEMADGVNKKQFTASDLVIVDSYKATSKHLTEIKNFCDICAVIDDNCTLPFYDADLVINPNIGAERFPYETRSRKDTALLLGTDYLMLREGFLSTSHIDVSKEIKHIAITMGGSDTKRVTEKVLKLLEKHGEYIYDVAVGPGFGERPELFKWANEHENVVICNNADMPELFSRCGAAVSSCGSTVYELAFMGVPTIGIITADNQQNASIAMEDGGLIACAGLCEKLSEQYFDELFNDVVKNAGFRIDMHKKQKETVKKDGAKRIKQRIIEMFAG